MRHGQARGDRVDPDGTLANIEETVLLYRGERGRPRAMRVTTETDGAQRRLYDLLSLGAYDQKP